MHRQFASIMSELRRQRCLSQRQVAKELCISQALLSHYENGAREPGLHFLCRACDFYGVTADYLLGRTTENDTAARDALQELADSLRALADKAETAAKE